MISSIDLEVELLDEDFVAGDAFSTSFGKRFDGDVMDLLIAFIATVSLLWSDDSHEMKIRIF
jgi:hypothetical protein